MRELQGLPLSLVYSLPFNPDPQHWRNGDVYLIAKVPDTPPRKILAISVHNLQDARPLIIRCFDGSGHETRPPKSATLFFVYDLTCDQEGLTKLQDTYVKAGITLLP
jgi:hypothetical protein